MYDRSRQKYNSRCTIGRARSYLRHYTTCIATGSPYKDSFKGSLKSSISNTISYLNNLL